jgi:hypothetical protein
MRISMKQLANGPIIVGPEIGAANCRMGRVSDREPDTAEPRAPMR